MSSDVRNEESVGNSFTKIDEEFFASEPAEVRELRRIWGADLDAAVGEDEKRGAGRRSGRSKIGARDGGEKLARARGRRKHRRFVLAWGAAFLGGALFFLLVRGHI